MQPRSSLLALGLAAVTSALSPATAQTAAGGALLDPVHLTVDYATGVVTEGPPTDKDGTGYVDRWRNNDQSGRAGFRGGVLSPEEVLDWGVLSTDVGTRIVGRVSVGFATTALDPSIGGPGSSLTLRFYAGATGGCADAGRVPVAELVLPSLPGSTDGLPKAFVTTVILRGDDAFCLPDGAFGVGFLSTDTTTGGLFDATVPLLCLAGDPLGNPMMDPDPNGQVSLVDSYDPGVQAGLCTGEFDYGGGVADGSFFVVLEAPDVTGAPAASATFRNGGGVNPPTYAVAVPPVLAAFFSATDLRTNAGVGVFHFGYEDSLPGFATPYGELLLDPSSTNVLAGLAGPYLFDSAGNAAWRLAIPCDLDLCGYAFTTQTLEFGAGPQLKNAQDLVVGF